MLDVVISIIGTIIVVGGAISAILKGFYKTNKEALEDYKNLEEKFDAKINNLENRLSHQFKEDKDSLTDELEKISNKIDEMKIHYVSNENFKTYADSISQLLTMSTERMGRIENTLDDIREEISNLMLTQIQNSNHNINKH